MGFTIEPDDLTVEDIPSTHTLPGRDIVFMHFTKSFVND